MYDKNQIVNVTVTDLGIDGEGIGKIDGFPFFIKDALPGDEIEARIIKAKKNYAYARLERVIKPSPFRIEAVCKFARQCGGCQIQALSYKKQLEFKQNKVRNNLIRIGGISESKLDEIMEPIIGMEAEGVPLHYRNKAQYPFGMNKEGKTVCGFYAGRTHSIIANTNCLLGATENKEILEIVLAFMERNHILPYDEENGKGLIRHVLIRKGFSSGEIMVCIVINGKTLPKADLLTQELVKIKGMTSISYSVNEARNNVILGDNYHTIWGSDTITDEICPWEFVNATNADINSTSRIWTRNESAGVKFQISPLSFYQVNPVQTEQLYSIALDYAGLTGKEVVWDLYCGIGTISLFMAKKAARVCGVEIVPQAIADAWKNAHLNGTDNVSFYVGKAEDVLPAFYEGKNMNEYELTGEYLNLDKGDIDRNDLPFFKNDLDYVKKYMENRSELLSPDVICVDPPRKGCDEACLSTMVQMQPKRIVYVSCDSATLARDVKYLCEHGYEVKRVRACDMFANTVHVETVVLLTHQKQPDDYLRIHVEMDELDKTKSESKATYERVKDYVKNKYDLKVNNLYIAQVKRDFGIIERENYNLGEGKARVPQCPKEKYDAIVDALKYFKMIA